MEKGFKIINRIINILVLISLVVFVAGLFTVKESYKHNGVNKNTDILEWETEDGGTVSIPITMKNNHKNRYRTTLPKIKDQEELWVNCNFSSLEVYIDGDMIFEEGKSSIYGKDTLLANGMAFVPLRPDYEGSEIEIVIEPYNTPSSRPVLKHTTIMTKSDYAFMVIRNNFPRILLAIIIETFAVITFVIFIYLTLFLKKPFAESRLYFYSGAFFMTSGAWTVTDGRMIGALTGHLTTSGFINYATFALLSFCSAGLARALYVKKSIILDIIYYVASLVFIIEIIGFSVFGIDLVKTLKFSQSMGAFVLMNLIFTSVLMVIKGDAAMKKRLAPGVILMSIFGLISLAAFFSGGNWSFYFLFALLMLLITIVIEVFSSLYDMVRTAIQVQEMRNFAYSDGLTGLKNRRAYVEALEGIPLRADKDSLIIVAIDLNGLKKVNDELGHAAGDEMISEGGLIIRESFIKYGETYRMGGDEFSTLFFGSKDALADCLMKMQERAASHKGELVSDISISFGYAVWADHPDNSITEIEKMADADMYHNKSEYYKRTGKDRRR